MAMEEALRGLREFDINDLDFENVGSWPIAVKAICWTLVLAVVLAGGYYYHVKGLQEQAKKVLAATPGPGRAKRQWISIGL